MPTYLKFHKNACNCLKEKRARKLRQKMMLEKEAEKSFPVFHRNG